MATQTTWNAVLEALSEIQRILNNMRELDKDEEKLHTEVLKAYNDVLSNMKTEV